MSNIELFGFPGSTYLRTVQMVCEHKGVDYTITPIEFGADSHRKLHPFLKVPIMKHGDIQLFESLAICQYLEDISPDVKLIPQATPAKALAYQWISAYIDYLAPILIHGKPDGESHDWPAPTSRYLQILDDALSKYPFLAGESPCLADLYVSPGIQYALQAPGFDMLLTPHQHLLRWWKRASNCIVFENTQAA